MQNQKYGCKNSTLYSWASSHACGNLLELFQGVADVPYTTACSVRADGKSDC